MCAHGCDLQTAALRGHLGIMVRESGDALLARPR